MSRGGSTTRSEVYKRLKKAFYRFSDSLDAHLDDALLYELGVDHVQVDLEDETEQGGPYFLPMSQERMDGLDKRPEFAITFDDEWSSSVWCYDDSDTVNMAYREQLYRSNDETAWSACGATHWKYRWYVPMI